jgi:hypothetical protein
MHAVGFCCQCACIYISLCKKETGEKSQFVHRLV